MGLIPDSKIGKLEFYESHIGQWTENAPEVGLVPSAMSALAALITAARTAYTAQLTAAIAAKEATGNANLAISAMHALGSASVLQIRAFAETSNNPGVFLLAGLPIPAPPTPMGPPGKPREFEVEILSGGALRIEWKCENPPGSSGTVYEVRRKIASGPFAMIGAGGSDRVFVDDTLPVGSQGVVYSINGLRGTSRGPSVEFNVNFGVASGGGGLFIQSVDGATTVNAKAAA